MQKNEELFEKLTYKDIEVKKLNMELELMMKSLASRDISMFSKNRFSQQDTMENSENHSVLNPELEKKDLALQEKENIIQGLKIELEKTNQQVKEKYLTIEQLKVDLLKKDNLIREKDEKIYSILKTKNELHEINNKYFFLFKNI